MVAFVEAKELDEMMSQSEISTFRVNLLLFLIDEMSKL